MAKLVVLYTRPNDPDGFDEYYRKTHMPLARRVSGAHWCLTRWTGTPRGGEPPYYLMAEATFDTDDALRSGMTSPEMRETGKDAAQMVQRFGNEAVMLVGTEIE